MGQRDGHLLALGHVDDADRLTPLLGDERVLQLDKGDGTGTAHGLHAGQSLTGQHYQERCSLGEHRDRAQETHLRIYVVCIFWILSPVWTRDSWDLETGINLEGWVRQLRQVRISTDINVEFDE